MDAIIANLRHEGLSDLSPVAQISVLKAELARSEELRAQLAQTVNDLADRLQEASKKLDEANATREQVEHELEMVKDDRLRMMADRDELETDREKLFQEIYLFMVKSLELANKRFRDPSRGITPSVQLSAPSTTPP